MAAITLRLCRENQLQLPDKITPYLPAEWMEGLHIYHGKDYSKDITVNHLLTQTSGLPCYLIGKRPAAPKLMDVLQSKEQEWSAEQVVAQVKQMKPLFRPGQRGKANYTNTNFRLLAKVLETVTGQTIDKLLTSLFNQLGLRHTYVLSPGEERTYTPVYFKEKRVSLPRYLASSGYDIVSTARDQMTFLKAFFDGYFYPKEQLQEEAQWNPVFFPFKYGKGMQQFYIPRILSPFKPFPPMIGHAGSTGSFGFWIPARNVFITGTINQSANPNLAFQTMVKIINQL